MKLDPFEKEIQELPWKQAPASLEERLWRSDRPERDVVVRRWFNVPIKVGWAAALALGAGIIGFGTGRLDSPRASGTARWEHADLHIIETGVDASFFDLVPVPEDPWPGPLKISVQESSEENG